MKNFITLSTLWLQCLIVSGSYSSSIDLQNDYESEYEVTMHGASCYATPTPNVDSMIVVDSYDETEKQREQNGVSWYQRPYYWFKSVRRICSPVQSEDTTEMPNPFNDNIVNDHQDSFKTKHLKFAVKFWRYADHGTEVMICICTSAATAFYILPDHNKCTDEWSYTDFGSVFTSAATLLGIGKMGIKYIGSLRSKQLEAIQQ